MFEFIKKLFRDNAQEKFIPEAESVEPSNTETITVTPEFEDPLVDNEQSEQKTENNDNSVPKAKIYNLIIVDESFSMMKLRNVTLFGINETISTLKNAQKEFCETQQHYLTLVTFDTRGSNRVPPVREIMSAVPVDKVEEFNDYHPNGSTPLYDAMGQSLTKLYDMIKDDLEATGCVTVLTDGLENSSIEWRADALRKLIDKLKELGWSFSYMGSAHNVKDVADLLSIDNVVEFSHDAVGASTTWGRERSSKMAYYREMDRMYSGMCMSMDVSPEEIRRKKRDLASNYYGNRISPENIAVDYLCHNEVIVVSGETDGLNGQVYTINTNCELDEISKSVNDFLNFASSHRDMKFFVTELKRGNMPIEPRLASQYISWGVELENVCLPEVYWDALGLKL